MATEQELRAFMRRRLMVRFERRFEPGSITGYVVGVGPDLCMLLHIVDGGPNPRDSGGLPAIWFFLKQRSS
jgi:hypothetical protein